ncbi:MAG: 3-methyl-2-oxobutanoate hydroxymethyltransferase, partial [Oscillospiraceae bacterium]|nr:3-methyl-2-oxobutanoate hydroxymethyltransferase [Oscillospiraceae bacterium]
MATYLQERKLVTTVTLGKMYRAKEKITMLTCYDASFAALMDRAGVEILLIGDSLGMVCQGRDTTLPVTIEDCAYHTACVARGNTSAMILTDMPFGTFATPASAYENAVKLMQAGAHIKAIIEGMDHEGGFPVQANRVRRLGIPIMTSHVLLKAIPNADHSGIVGAVIAECKNFKPIPGTEKIIDDIDIINICTGLIPDGQFIAKGKQVFGLNTYGCGDAVRIGEGTSAVLRGKQAAFEVAQNLGVRYNYDEYLEVSRQYIDSQQRPVRILEKPNLPDHDRMFAKPFVQLDCLYGFACNPCSFSCPQKAITKSSTSSTPSVDYSKCIGCMQCVNHCPGLAIFGYDLNKDTLFLPVEYEVEEGKEVFLIDNNGKKVGEGLIEKVLKKSNKTNVVRVKATTISGEELIAARGFILKDRYPKPIDFKPVYEVHGPDYVCHCEDIDTKTLLEVIGDRKFISIDELKHITRMGMG